MLYIVMSYYYSSCFYRGSNEANIPSLVLANLKWLDYIVDSDTLTTKIVEIIEGSPLKV